MPKPKGLILTYQRCHQKNFSDELKKAKLIADYAVKNKKNKKVLTSKYVKHIGLKSALSNQILRKFSGKTIKKAKNVNLVVPHQAIKWFPRKSLIKIVPMNFYFKWNPGRPCNHINQIEISNDRIFISVTYPEPEIIKPDDRNIVGVDLNATHHVACVASLSDGKILKLGKQGPNIRKMYFKKRKRAQEEGNIKMVKQMKNREYRRTKDLDHKISKKIVEYAQEKQSCIVLENLKDIRKRCTKGKGSRSRNLNRLVNNWSFYRLGEFITYKAKLYGVPLYKVPPHYTSQTCSRCCRLGKRNKKEFVCTNRGCDYRDHADINAGFCICKRYLGEL